MVRQMSKTSSKLCDTMETKGLPFNYPVPEMVKQSGHCWKRPLGNNVCSLLRKPNSHLGSLILFSFGYSKQTFFMQKWVGYGGNNNIGSREERKRRMSLELFSEKPSALQHHFCFIRSIISLHKS